jgi:diguanylate cyclase (GGDEF)-like protein
MARRGLARLESMAIGNAGIAAQRVGSLDLALDRLCRADRMQVANRSTSHRAITQSHIGEIDLALGQRAQRIAAISEAITSMAEGRPRDRMEAWDALAIVDEANGDAAAALAAMKEARAIERRLHDEDAHVAAAECEQRAEISRIVDEWSRLADPDALTGLPNRRAFDRRMSELLALAHKGTPFALILFDLDHFKRINDLYGHAIGDAVLKRFAHLLAADRRASDPPARVGGEEFAVLVLSTIGETTVIAERVRTAVAAADSTAIDPGLSVTFSAGVACSHEVGDVATVFARADQRLYVAKNKGRNRIVATD